MDYVPLQQTSVEVWQKKYQLKDNNGEPIDTCVDDTFKRVAKALSKNEDNPSFWEKEFTWALKNGATPAGRILSNSGAEKYKPATSTINCVVSRIIEDSMSGILKGVYDSGLSLAAGCGIGYEFSTLRPNGAFVSGAGASTSGALSFMDIYDKSCFTVSSAGGRRGAQMATFAVWHPDVEDFITAKRENGRFRQFNLSLLIDNEFMEAVKNKQEWDLCFPVKNTEALPEKTILKDLFWEEDYCKEQNYRIRDGKILCKVYKTIQATDLWDTIMDSTYNFSEPKH